MNILTRKFFTSFLSLSFMINLCGCVSAQSSAHQESAVLYTDLTQPLTKQVFVTSNDIL